MPRFKSAAIILMVFSLPAYCEERPHSPPVYDVESGCLYQAGGIIGNNPSLYNECVSSEQRDYNFIKSVWPRLSDKSVAFFIKIAGEITKGQKVPVRMYSSLSRLALDLIMSDRREQIERTPQKFVP